MVIYLELCTLSLSNKGYLRVEITSAEMSYTSILAKDIGEDILCIRIEEKANMLIANHIYVREL